MFWRMPDSREVEIRGFLLDMDGVIINSEWISKVIWYAIFSGLQITHSGLKINWEALANLKLTDLLIFNGRNAADRKQICLDWFGEEFPFDEAYQKRAQAMKQLEEASGIPLCFYAREFLEFTHQVHPVAVVTSTDKIRAKSMLGHHSLMGLISGVVGGDSITKGKPDPEPFQKGAEKISRSPFECVAIEDSTAGLKAANRAGCITVMIPDGNIEPSDEDRELATGGIFVSFEEVVKHLKRHNPTA